MGARSKAPQEASRKRDLMKKKEVKGGLPEILWSRRIGAKKKEIPTYSGTLTNGIFSLKKKRCDPKFGAEVPRGE